MLLRLNRVQLVRFQHTWIKPVGCETGVNVYNCVAKKLEPLVVHDKNCVTWYTCGPTVYAASHIGHACCYVKLDIVQRILRSHYKLNIVSVMNITDIDDKIIRSSEGLKVPPNELARRFEKEFWLDIDALNVKRPDRVVRVTENMPVILDFIDKLVDAKKAYKVQDGSVYFDVEVYDGKYGKLQNIGDCKGGKDGGKRSAADFAVWKGAKLGEPSWDSRYGKGRPGWHIECSALASKVLGSTIDIHAGGIDLRFPHHENEEAQSCAYFCKPQWVNYWLHTGHLHLRNSAKMSKSLGNTISVTDLLRTCDAEVFRMACLMSHYRSNMEFSDELVRTAKAYLQTYKNFVVECDSYLRSGTIKASLDSGVLLNALAHTTNDVTAALSHDFNTSECIKSLNNLVGVCNKVLHSAGDGCEDGSAALMAILNYTTTTLRDFGLNLAPHSGSVGGENDIGAVMDVLVDFRGDLRTLGIARKDKEVLKMCDDVREKIRGCGFNLSDRGKVSTWSK